MYSVASVQLLLQFGFAWATWILSFITSVKLTVTLAILLAQAEGSHHMSKAHSLFELIYSLIYSDEVP